MQQRSSKLNLRHIKFSFSLTENNSNSPQEYETAPHLLIQAFWVEQLGKETLKEVPSTEQGTVHLENMDTSNVLSLFLLDNLTVTLSVV